MTRLHFRVSRFDPAKGEERNEAPDWTSLSDVGLTFSDGVLTLERYEHEERKYLDATSVVLELGEVTAVQVSDVEISPWSSDQARAINDGLIVDIAGAVRICRMLLREDLSCRLKATNGRVIIDAGFDLYLYFTVDTDVPSDVLSAVRQLGLFIEENVFSPYE